MKNVNSGSFIFILGHDYFSIEKEMLTYCHETN